MGHRGTETNSGDPDPGATGGEPQGSSESDPDRTVLAVDIGGTKIEAAVVTAGGEIHVRRRISTVIGDPAGPGDPGGGRRLIERVISLLVGVLGAWDAEGGEPPRRCGVGCGGPMRRGGETVSPLNIGVWRDFPLRAELAAGLPMSPAEVIIDNDAKALALAEGWRGAARGVDDYLAMVVSTGVGGGIVLGGRLLEGATGNAGHIGHVVVVPDGRLHAGIRGSLEGEASGTAIAELCGCPPAQAGPQWRERTGTLVGRAVGDVCNLLDLRLAVVAGSVALGYGPVFFAAAQAELDRVARLDFSRGARIVPAGLGADGPLLGAAALALPAGPARSPQWVPEPGSD